MGKLEQKVVTDADGKQRIVPRDLEEYENLGLDADHSSENTGYRVNLNNDNDRISHNPDGEDDDSDSFEEPGWSPLMDK